MTSNLILIFALIASTVLQGEVGRFLEPITFGQNKSIKEEFVKTSGFVVPAQNLKIHEVQYIPSSKVTIDRLLVEKKLSEVLAHRYQASGKVSSFLTRDWRSFEIGSNFIIKITDCMPDELVSSTFVRFSIWDQGKLLGNFAEPVRLAHYVDVFFSDKQFSRGARLDGSMFTTRPVDVLKQFAGAVPASSKLTGYQLSSNVKSNAAIRWNQLSKVTLVQKGKVVDVFASGNGIYVTMKGMALESGVEGGLVKIKNLSSDKIFHAKVLNENSVKVHL
ncbi:MAG: flagellar basal body P-ring formation chaperone FlgA [Opitutales bacterium]|nr:flagellar basal body P-ring formation chaperone FlgA [Opitutales bacterium]